MSAMGQETSADAMNPAEPERWSRADVQALYSRPLLDLVFEAQTVHRQHFEPNVVQMSTLLSIKTGACPEDCSYCPQSVRYDTGLEAESLMARDDVVEAAARAKQAGATRFCVGAAYRGPKDKELEPILGMISSIKAMGLETCATLGLLRDGQAEQLAAAGLDYYNHNIDTSPEYYANIITTRKFSDRLDTLSRVRGAGIKVCCGGIMGLGESRVDRISFLHTLANLETPPESVPINRLVRVPGTPLEAAEPLDNFEFVRTVAAARILMPDSHVRLSAGRSEFSDEMQALCFMAGANSIFLGEKLLTTGNPDTAADHALFARLGLHAEAAASES